jgi:hypothetical protein
MRPLRPPGLPASKIIATPVHPRSSQDQTGLNSTRRLTVNELGESRELESHTLRCHRFSKPCRRACPVDSPWWKVAVPIRSACTPGPLPTGAGPRPVHFPKIGGGRVHSKPMPFRHHRFSGPRRSPDRFTLQIGHHDRSRTCILRLRRAVLIRLSYVVMLSASTLLRTRQLILIARALRPNRGSPSSFRGGSSADMSAARRAARTASAPWAHAAASG